MKTEVRDETKTDRVVGAARKLFMENGFEKTTMEEIARAVPMSKATLYSVFPKKEEILLAICAVHCVNMQQALRAGLSETRSDYLKALPKMLTQWVTSVYEESSSVKTPEQLIYVSARIKTRFHDQFAQSKAIIRDVLQRAIDAGEVAQGADADVLCEVIVTTLTAYLPPYSRPFSTPVPERPDRKAFDAELELLFELLINGLKNHKRG